VIERGGVRYVNLGGLLIPEHAMSFPDEGVEFLSRALYEKEDREFERLGLKPVRGGDDSFPFEGLDVWINTTLRKTGTQMPDPGYLGLFTSQTATTVPAQTAVLATATGVTEATGGGYARPAIPGSSWPAAATADSTGRRTTVADPGISFAESTGAYTVTNVNGFFLATAVTAGVAIFYSNFTSGVAIVVNQAGFVVQVPPFAQLTDSP
jgi:hypothetical protein